MTQRTSLVTSMAVYLPVLWLVSSIARGKGFVLLAGGLVALVFASWRFVRGRRNGLYALYFATLLCAATIGLMELLLFAAPSIVRGKLANYVYGGYHNEPDGIYRADRHLGRTMRSNKRRQMYWNGHWWLHETNQDGYRGPARKRAAAVFLGDSMVYGHGVETNETVAAHFERMTGLSAANLGQQGTGALQALFLLRDKGAALEPEFLFFCSHPTDIVDVGFWYEVAEIQKFLDSSAADPYLPLVRPEWRGTSPSVFEWWLVHGAIPLRSARLVRGLLRQSDAVGIGPEPMSKSDETWRPSEDALLEPFTPGGPAASVAQQLAWAAHRHAIGSMKHLCDELGSSLVLYDLGYSVEFSAAIEDLARELGASYSPAGRVALERAQANEEVYLANDGHWTPYGNEIIARELARLMH